MHIHKRWLYLIPAVAVVAVLVVSAALWFRSDRMSSGLETSPPLPSGTLSAEELDKRIEDYLKGHPEVIVEAVRGLQARQQASRVDELKDIIKARSDQIFRDPDAPVVGNPNGDAAIVEFFDYNCPYCRQVAPILAQVMSEDSSLRLVYKEFPILGPNSELAARAALASVKQGKYAAFHDALFASHVPVTKDAVMDVAKTVGIDTARLEQDMQDPAIAQAIERNHKLAEELRITGTPSFVIGDHLQIGALDLATIRALIARARQGQ